MSPRRRTSTGTETLSSAELREIWPLLDAQEKLEGFEVLPRPEAEDFFLSLGTAAQGEFLFRIPQAERRLWVRLLAPDDAADLLQSIPAENREALWPLFDDITRREVAGLMAYKEDHAGGLMNPRFARLRPNMTVDEAITYLRREARESVETLYYAYVVDPQQKLLGVVSFRDLFKALPSTQVSEMMKTDLVTLQDDTDQEKVSRLFAEHDFVAMPVVDAEGRLKGIVTVDDIVDVIKEEATEDMQRLGGMETLNEPYLDVGLWDMIRKRAGWLTALFLGEMLTATAMGYYQHELEAAVVLGMFIPLIISSGGNSGSQATTLIIRAMALGEVRRKDLLRVAKRELVVGLSLGGLLGAVGFFRIMVWPGRETLYTEHYHRVAVAVAWSLLGVVLWGTLVGSMLPFALRKVGFDPARASAPLVATLVDVTGLIIYFSVASLILRGTLL